MGDSLFRVNRGVTLNPQSSVPTNPVNGDIYYNSTMGSFVFYDGGFWINLASRADVASAASLTSAQFVPTIVQNSLMRVVGSTPTNLHGISASRDGRSAILYNQTSVNVVIKHQSATEPTAANRIICNNNADMTLTAGQTATLVYDFGQNRWVVLSTGGGSSFDPNTMLTDDVTGNIITSSIDGNVVLSG